MCFRYIFSLCKIVLVRNLALARKPLSVLVQVPLDVQETPSTLAELAAYDPRFAQRVIEKASGSKAAVDPKQLRALLGQRDAFFFLEIIQNFGVLLARIDGSICQIEVSGNVFFIFEGAGSKFRELVRLLVVLVRISRRS